MRDILLYTVNPKIPEGLKPLESIARNLWFCWNLEGIDLFRSIDQNLWEESSHNPLAMLSLVPQDRLYELMMDEGFLHQMNRISEEFKGYVQEKKSYDFGLDNAFDFPVAYFSAEFGLTDCLPIYSGGLGILSGDHVKSASDLRIPIVGVGLLYQRGYFQQYLNADGWQLETYSDNHFQILPIQLEKDEKGDPLTIEVPIQGRRVKIRVWRIQVGRVPLFMLDTNTVENIEADRDITSSLYGGNIEVRLKQEIVLGIGGVRVLDRMGIEPSVFHMNEGHSAFATIERIRLLMKKHGLSFQEAREAVYCSNVFTTHTPVPAGFDVFDPGLLHATLKEYIETVGISMETFLSMGRRDGRGSGEPLNMAVMALKNASQINGVSLLHQKVSQRMWNHIWPSLPEDDVPIEGITNGIHIPSWISSDMAGLYDRYLGRRWAEDPDNIKIWERVNRIPDPELWRTHERRRERLVAFARKRLQEQLIRRGAPKNEIQEAAEALSPQVLTIGFARRFATYKRGDLILKDVSRLAKLFQDTHQPLQIIFAGKAHPQDDAGKEVIRKIIHLTQQPEFRKSIVFIEDYDLNVARYLVQGSDVWLNNPRRPLEACGTSGMKAAANGALNLSVLDGWWAEGYQSGLGWAIGSGEEYEDLSYQDNVESKAIYHLLEKTIIPLFYNRGHDNLPREWIGMMKRSMQILAARFNSHRMLEDYVHRFYAPSARHWNRIKADQFKGARELAQWINYLKSNWSQVQILEKSTQTRNGLEVGQSLNVEVSTHLGRLSANDLSVEIYYGRVDSKANFLSRNTIPLTDFTQEGDQTVFRGEIVCREVGRFGFRVRILPSHPLLINPYSLGLVLWG
jgi:glycogen phosphorylase